MTRPTITRSKFPMLPFEQSLLEKYGGVGWLLNDVAGNPYCNVINTAVPLGRNIALDGDFATDTIWTKDAGWSISGGTGVATAAAVNTKLQQASICQIGRTYQITYDVVVTSGSVRIGGCFTGVTRSASGTYTEVGIATITAVNFTAQSTFTGTIDNVTCKELNIPAYNAIPVQLLNTDVWNGAGTGVWTPSANATLSAPSTTRHDGSTGTVLRIARNGGLPNARQLSIFTVGQVYRIYGWWRGDGTAVPRIINNAGSLILAGTASTDWQPFDFVLVATETMFIFQASTTTGTTYCEFDVTVVSLDTGIRQDSPGLDMNMEALADSGTATAGASTTLTDSGKTWTTNQHATRLVTITGGTGAGQTRAITSNTATVLTTAAWTVNPDNTSAYQIIAYWSFANGANVTKSTAAPHSGTYNIRIARKGTNTPLVSQSMFDLGKTYLLTGWAKGDGTANPRILINNGSNAVFAGTTSTSWQQISVVFSNVSSSTSIQLTANGATVDGQFVEYDDLVLTELSPLVGVPNSGATLGNSEAPLRIGTSVSFNGSSGLINLYSTQLNSVFSPDEGTLLIFGKVNASGNWTDGVQHAFMTIRFDVSNFIIIQKSATNNQLVGFYTAGGTSKSVGDISLAGSLGWICVAVTYSKSADQLIFYINGVAVGSVQTGLGTWTGNLATTTCVIGSSSTGSAQPWAGKQSQAFLLPHIASASEIAEWASLGDVSQ